MSIFSVARRNPAISVALAVSVGLHGAVGVWVKVRGPGLETPAPPLVDVWSGRSVEVAAPEVDTVSIAEPADERTIPSPDERSSAVPEVPVAVEPVCVSNCAREEPKVVTREEKRPATTAPSVRAPKLASSAPSVASAATPSASTTDAPTTNAPSTTAGDAFGMTGLPPGVRHLPKAYTRALNQGSWRVAGFRTVPSGKLCEAHVSIAVGGDRRLGELQYRKDEERDALPPLCRTMFENGQRLVANGEFSLDPKRLTDGVLRLRIEVHVTDGEPRAESEDSPNELWSESYESPSAGKRGRSTFVLNSGRRVDALVEVE